jgi:hypothetical protein
MNVLIRSVDEPRLSDVIRASVDMSDKDAKIIDYCHNISMTTWVGYNDERLVCAWGIIPPSILSDEVYLWLHVTGAIRTSQFLFVRHSQMFIQKTLKEYKAIVGHVKADATGSKRWLKWLGAEFYPGKNGYLNFRIERHGPN